MAGLLQKPANLFLVCEVAIRTRKDEFYRVKFNPLLIKRPRLNPKFSQ